MTRAVDRGLPVGGLTRQELFVKWNAFNCFGNMKTIDINVYTSDTAESRLIKIAEDATIEELIIAARTAGAAVGEPGDEIILLVEDKEVTCRKHQKVHECGIRHGHHLRWRHHEQHRHHHALVLTIVVNGTPAEIEANPEAPLESVIPKALKQTGNEGQPPQNWELKDAKGTALDVSKKIEDYHFPCGVKLFLSLKAGVGGSCGNAR